MYGFYDQQHQKQPSQQKQNQSSENNVHQDKIQFVQAKNVNNTINDMFFAITMLQ
jgi:hypothetical protein